VKIRLGHSPDADDAYMWAPLKGGRVATAPYEIEHVIEPIETLNQRAQKGELEATALSIHAYALVADRYVLTHFGASMGLNYGPVLVARAALNPRDLGEKTVAIPGWLTSAYLAYRIYLDREKLPTPRFKVLPFDRIQEAVRTGSVVAGLLIHEGQLTYEGEGLHRLVDLGKWWYKFSGGLPLPLGGNALRKDLAEHLEPVATILKASIVEALENPTEALHAAQAYARDLPPQTLKDFVDMYVNQSTLDYGRTGRDAVRLFLSLGAECGLLEQRVTPEFI